MFQHLECGAEIKRNEDGNLERIELNKKIDVINEQLLSYCVPISSTEKWEKMLRSIYQTQRFGVTNGILLMTNMYILAQKSYFKAKFLY